MFVRRAGLMSARVARPPPELAPRRGQNPPPFRSTTLLALAIAALGGCSDFGAPDPKLGVTASPRVTAVKSVAKGGGAYKVGRPYKIAGRWYIPRRVASYVRTGTASWYGSAFHGRRTANGEVYDMGALTAGHPTLPLPSYAYVTNLQNGRTILVRINDRGPYVRDRLIDLSWRAAKELGFATRGLARVRVRYAGRAPLDGTDTAERQHLAAQSWHGSANQAVAQNSITDLPAGAVASFVADPNWSVTGYRQQMDDRDLASSGATLVGLGGPQSSSLIEVGPFTSLAEAERMRHELRNAGMAVIESTGTDDEPAYRVRAIPLSSLAAENSGDQIRGQGGTAGAAAPQ